MVRWKNLGVIAVLCLAVSTMPYFGYAQVEGNDDIETESILRAWEARQQQVRSFDVVCEGVEYNSAGLLVALGGGGLSPIQSDMPDEKGHTFPVEMRFVADAGCRVRFDYTGEAWSGKERRYVSKVQSILFDGTSCVTHFPIGTNEYPMAYIEKKGSSSIVSDVHLYALRLALRPLGGEIGFFDRTGIQMTEQRYREHGGDLVILKHSRGQVWADPMRDFLPVRYLVVREGKTECDIEIEYTRDESHGWLPKSWKTSVLRRDGSPTISASFTVSACRINQEPVDEMFVANFAAGTWIHDYMKDEVNIRLESGKHRRVLPGEYGKTYEELIGSMPRLNVIRWIFVGSLVILIVVIVVSFARKRWMTV